MRAIPLAILLLGCGLAARAYDASSLAADAAAFLDLENRARRDLAAAVSAQRQSQPHMQPQAAFAPSFDLSLGAIVAPAFEYRGDLGDSGPFPGLVAGDGASAASVVSPAAALSLQWASGAAVDLGASYFLPLDLDGARSSLYRIGARGSWRIVKERFYSMGLRAGAGASVQGGRETRDLSSTFDDGGVAAKFAGTLDSRWDSGLVDLELFLHKTFFVINFYTRANLGLGYCVASSTLESVSVGGSAVAGADRSYGRASRGFFDSLVVGAGMELILGVLKLGAECGRDWSSGALYGSAALRWGL